MSHIFNILDYTDKLEQYGKLRYSQTWIQGICPICQGKLKISLTANKYGAYACYTNECHKLRPNPIRKLLFTKTAFNQSTSFDKEVIIPQFREFVNPVKLKVKPKDFLTNIKFEKPKTIFTNSSDDVIEKGISFRYKTFEMVRVDRRYKNNTKSKFFYPRYFDTSKNEYVDSLPILSEPPIYKDEYLQDTVLFVEGEKCATVGHMLGMAMITIPSFAMSELYLETYIQSMRGKVKNVLYLEDNDRPGQLKAKELVNRFWKYEIGAGSVNIADVYGYRDRQGFDVYDLYREGKLNKSSVNEFLENCISYATD